MRFGTFRRRSPTGSRYDAFISYSHTADEPVATALRDALHAFSKPWYALRALQVFLDRASLSAAPDLWSDVRRQLDASRFLILLASPEAAQSDWVGPREIVHWLSLPERADRLIIACTDGAVEWDDGAQDFDWRRTTALPTELRGALEHEPLYVDLRWARTAEHLTLGDDRFLAAVADIAAPLHGRPKDQLVGEDIRQHRRTKRVVRATIAVLSILTVAATALAVVAIVQRNRAEERARIATSRQLASEADARAAREPILATLLSVAAYETRDTVEARASMLHAMDERRQVLRFLPERSGTPQDVRNEGFGIAYSPDGRILASGREDGSVLVWEAESKTLVATLRGEEGRVFDVAFSPDGRTLAAATFEGVVTIWDVAREDRTAEIPGPDGSTFSVAFSPDGQLLAVGGYDQIALWNGAGSERLGLLRGHEGTAIRDVAFSPDGSLLASGSHDSTLALWNVAEERRVAVFPHGTSVFGVAWSPDGQTVAGATQAGSVVLSDVQRQSLPGDLPHSSSVFGVAFSPDGASLAAATSNGDIVLWDVESGDAREFLNAEVDAAVNGIAFSPDGEMLASAGEQPTVLWDLSPPETLSLDFEIDHMEVAADGHVLAAGGGDDLVLRDPRAPGPESGATALDVFTVNGLALSGSVLAVGGYDEVELWDIDSRKKLGALSGHDDAPVYSVAITPDRRLVAAATETSKIVLWDAQRGARLGVLDNGDLPAYTMTFSPDGRTLATDSQDAISLWDVRQRTRVALLTGHGDHVEGLAFSPDGRLLASASSDETIILWDVAQGTRLGTLTGHTDRVNTVAFNADGTLLASGAHDNTVRLWDVERRAGLGALTNHSFLVSDVEFMADGTLVSASDDGTVALFDPDPDSWRRRLCDLAGRDLTDEERHELGLDPDLHVCA